MEEYEVVWNGARGPLERDSLQVFTKVREPVERHPAPVRPNWLTGRTSTLTLRVLDLLAKGPTTKAAIQAATGSSHAGVEYALRRVRDDPHFRQARLADPSRKALGNLGGRPSMYYWLENGG